MMFAFITNLSALSAASEWLDEDADPHPHFLDLSEPLGERLNVFEHLSDHREILPVQVL